MLREFLDFGKVFMEVGPSRASSSGAGGTARRASKKHSLEEKKTFILKYNYDLLLRSLLKITYNSSRTVTRINNDFDRFKNYILLGTEIREDIVVKLDIVTPAILNGQKLYPKSARCGVIVLNVRQENYILRVIAVNSFYFFIIISRNERITSKSAELELSHIISRIPGTIIHPYSNEIRATDFSDFDTFTIHQSHILTNKEYYHKFLKKLL